METLLDARTAAQQGARRVDPLVRQARRRTATLIVLVLVLAAVAASDPLHQAIRSLVALAEPLIQRHAILGAIVFVLLSAFSAMVVFFSTAAITPVAVEAYGTLIAMLLLWSGWILGGMIAWSIGRFLGRRAASWLIDPRKLLRYTRRAKRITTFRHILLFQIAVPSEIPGYVLGLAGCRFRTFVAAIAIGELPYAIGAVFLGESFLTGNVVLLLAIGLTGVALSWAVFRRAAKIWAEEP